MVARRVIAQALGMAEDGELDDVTPGAERDRSVEDYAQLPRDGEVAGLSGETIVAPRRLRFRTT